MKFSLDQPIHLSKNIFTIEKKDRLEEIRKGRYKPNGS